MLILLSPAKTLDMTARAPAGRPTKPRLLDDSVQLIDILQESGPQDLKKLMKVSDAIAETNYHRFQEWTPEHNRDNAAPALFAFRGDVYQGLDADSLDAEGLRWAQAHLRILSGLYGVLRPMDLIHAYRLEMGTKLANDRGKDLYAFWGDRITRLLHTDGGDQGPIMDLASQEYDRSVDFSALTGPVIAPRFLDWSKGTYKMISFYAKRARGTMARWLIDERVERADDVAAFDRDGYAYDPQRSQDGQPTFIRRGS